MDCMIKDAKIDNVLLAFFFSPDTTFKSLNVANCVNELFGDFFKNDPNIITLPPNVPIDVPRLVYNQDANQLSIGFSRADFTIKFGNTTDWKKAVQDFGNRLKQLFIDNLKIRVIRVGLVANFNFNNDCTTREFLHTYINSDKLDEVVEYNMSWRSTLEVNGITTNKWMRLFISENPVESRVFVIDLNTIAEQILDLGKVQMDDIIASFIQCIEGEIQNVL